MDIREIVEQIDSLKTQVHRSTHSYMMDADCTDIIDNQLNGYVRAIQSYCLVSLTTSPIAMQQVNTRAIIMQS